MQSNKHCTTIASFVLLEECQDKLDDLAENGIANGHVLHRVRLSRFYTALINPTSRPRKAKGPSIRAISSAEMGTSWSVLYYPSSIKAGIISILSLAC